MAAAIWKGGGGVLDLDGLGFVVRGRERSWVGERVRGCGPLDLYDLDGSDRFQYGDPWTLF